MRRAPWFFFGGVALFVCGLLTGSYVPMTGLLGVMLGASVLGFGHGIGEGGARILAALIWLVTVFMYAVLAYVHVWHVFDRPGDLVPIASLAIATWLLGIQSRFLLTTAFANWRV